MADAKFIISSLNAMARATQSSLKMLMGKIEYRKIRNQLVHNDNTEDSIDQLIQKVTDNITKRQKFANVLVLQLQESCDTFISYLESFSSPIMQNEVSLAEKQVDLFVSAYNRDNEDIRGEVIVPEKRLKAVISKLESLPDKEQIAQLVSKLKEWEKTWNEDMAQIPDR